MSREDFSGSTPGSRVIDRELASWHEGLKVAKHAPVYEDIFRLYDGKLEATELTETPSRRGGHFPGMSIITAKITRDGQTLQQNVGYRCNVQKIAFAGPPIVDCIIPGYVDIRCAGCKDTLERIEVNLKD